MWQWLWFRCGRCREVRASGERALSSPLRPQLAICEECLRAWYRTGHRCAQCWTAIQGDFEVGLLVETGAFAHVDCGGARLLGPPISGPADLLPPAPGAVRGVSVRPSGSD
jgi:hypothetical protein